MNNIYLVGFMACGKSVAGKALAAKLKRKFADIDELIELEQRQAIREIFAKKGESYFRKVEKAMLKQVSKEDNFVYACGGGIVIDPDNIKLMKQTGRVICLTAKPEVILKRSGDAISRPLLNVANPKKQIELLLKLRAPYYSQADKTIDTSKLAVTEVVNRIIRMTNDKIPMSK